MLFQCAEDSGWKPVTVLGDTDNIVRLASLHATFPGLWTLGYQREEPRQPNIHTLSPRYYLERSGVTHGACVVYAIGLLWHW